MGTDDLFKKRKARSEKAFSRHRKETRISYEKVLIVCEGEKTEYFYLEALREFLELPQAHVVIDPGSDSTPTSVVKYAKAMIAKNVTDPYSRVYCVIDRDAHTDFGKAMDQIEGYKSKTTKLHAIVSDPCFEYWILLHYIYTTKLFGTSGESPCRELISKELKTYIPDYEKGNASIMVGLVKHQLNTAVANAKRAYESAKRDERDTPLTQMHLLVEYLKNLKS